MKPWNKLWRKESARFKSMPLSARAMASYVLKFVDEGGALPLGKRDAVTAVALAVGAIPSERRWLRPAVEALVEHGYFAAQDGLLVIGNFPRYQEESAPIGRRSSNTSPTLVERSSDVGATLAGQTNDASATNDRHEISVSGGNDSLAQKVLSEISEEKESREGERESVRGLAMRSFKKRWESARKAMWPGTKGDPNWDLLARFLIETAKLRGTTVEALLTKKLDGWFADPYVIGKNHPTENFARYPEKHIDEEGTPSSAAPSANAPAISPVRARYEAACERVSRATDGTAEYLDAVDAKREAQRALHEAES